jgi:hypothetical protein
MGPDPGMLAGSGKLRGGGEKATTEHFFYNLTAHRVPRKLRNILMTCSVP